jgi:hypothetical protein
MFSPSRNVLIPVHMRAGNEPQGSPRYAKWFDSEDTQAKLKTGEYEIPGKSHDVNHA